MKRGVVLVLLVLAVPMVQGGIAPFLPVAARPDFSLLVVLALALCLRSSAGGLLLAALSGFAVDLFSSSLLGLHALLRVVVFAGARLLSHHVNLAGVLPQVLLAGIATLVHAAGVAALVSFFLAGTGVDLVDPGVLGLHTLANAVAAPFVTALVSALVSWLGDEEAGRRVLRLDPKNWVA